MLAGGLGLEKARIPHADRHGLMWLNRGRLEVEDGCLRFITPRGGDLQRATIRYPIRGFPSSFSGPDRALLMMPCV